MDLLREIIIGLSNILYSMTINFIAYIGIISFIDNDLNIKY